MMEPFGLFQFLQSLLKTPPAQEAQEEKNVPETPKEPPAETPTQVNNEVYLQFISNHEKRRQGVKKR